MQLEERRPSTAQPSADGLPRVLVLLHRHEQLGWIGLAADGIAVFFEDKPFCDRMIKCREEGAEVAADIEDAHRLLMLARLRPRDRLEKFVKRAKPPRQGDVSVGKFMHASLAMVHVDGDIHPGQPLVGEGGRVHRRNDHANDLSTCLKGAICECPHEARPPSAIHDGLAAMRERLAEQASCGKVLMMHRVRRTAEHADGLHGGEYTGRLTCESGRTAPCLEARVGGRRRARVPRGSLYLSAQIRIVLDEEEGA